MNEMTSHERFSHMFTHTEADRIPIIDSPWRGTILRWRREGMPDNVDWRDYFGVDKVESYLVDISPQFENKILEDTPQYTVYTSSWGVTMKQFKEADSTPEFIDYKVKTSEEWEKAKQRMTVDKDRIDWKFLTDNYPKWKKENRWIQAHFWFGFDAAHSWMSGIETILIAMINQPEWIHDMFSHYLDMCIAHFDMLWDAGYRFDSIFWPDDLGYKNSTFFSNKMYRELCKPYYKKAADWAHSKGMYVHLHSCGYIMPHIPDILEAGIDALNPIERKAGMDVLQLKKDYGDKLVLHGGINAVLWDDIDAIIAEIESLIPTLKKNGGYIFSSDHSIPNSVSLANFRTIVAKVKELGVL